MYNKKIFTGLIALIMATATYSQPPGRPPQGTVHIKSMHSQALNVERNYSIYLPKSYESDPGRHYPVLYLLHGVWGNNTDWIERGHLQDVANQVIDAEQAVEMIIVAPDAGTGWNGYFNMNGWPYETYFFQDFIPYIESTYRTLEGKKNRAIAGLSMGGGGATVYGQKYPHMFSSVYAISALMTLGQGGGLPEDDPRIAELNRTVRENDAVRFISSANEETRKQLRSVRWFVDCGDDDFLLNGNMEFVREMNSARIPLQFRVRNGGHSWEYWHSALYKLLPFVSFGFLQ
jgi:S-formylglutathione hydrolase FrmB